MSIHEAEDNIHRYSEAVGILYQSNMFVFTEPGLMQSLQTSILPRRWNIIRSLEVHWGWGDGSCLSCSRAYWALFQRKKRWKSASQVIKTLKALQHLTLIPRFSFCGDDAVSIRELALESLEPLKDLRLKNRWELKIPYSEEVIRAVDTTLKQAGFNCFVTHLKT
jgi:hypothetical protein